MSWLIKVSSITFSIQGSNKIGQPKTVSDIGNLMWTWATGHVPRNLMPEVPEVIAMDGYDTEATTGIINWYIPKDIDWKELQPYIAQCYYEELAPLGITIDGQLKHEPSGMFDNADVIRIFVTGNETVERNKLPELNVSNRNGMVLQELLGMTYSVGNGEINAHELKQRINNARPRVDAFALSGQNKDNNLEFGITPEQLIRYLDALDTLTNEALKMNNPLIIWS